MTPAMNDLIHYQKLAACLRAGGFLALFLVAGWLATSAQAGVIFTGANKGANSRPRWCKVMTTLSMAQLNPAAQTAFSATTLAPPSKSATMTQ
jgi:hypothetical protein